MKIVKASCQSQGCDIEEREEEKETDLTELNSKIGKHSHGGLHSMTPPASTLSFLRLYVLEYSRGHCGILLIPLFRGR